MEELLQKALELDQNDPLGHFKERFELEQNTIYLDGNSLGPPLKDTLQMIRHTSENLWQKRLIRGWNEDWLSSWKRISQKIAKLINAEPDEVLVTDSVSVNLYKLMYAVLEFKKSGTVIYDSQNFPSDQYIIKGLIEGQFPEFQLKQINTDQTETANEKVKAAIDHQTALVTLSHVAYKSAFRYDLKSINSSTKEEGAINLWDLSHSIGAVPIDVKEDCIDLAVGCTYKYLNGGPGSPAFLYVSKHLQNQLQNPIKGWFSHDKPFAFGDNYTPKNDVTRFAVGTPSMISMKAIEPGVDLHLEASPKRIWEKSERLYEYFLLYFQNFLKERNFNISTPLIAHNRGSHIALHHEEACRINLSLIEPRTFKCVFITDHRPPDIIRVALTPLYIGYQDIAQFCQRLIKIIDTKEYLNHSTEKKGVI
ncbi:kynureninase [Jiulongibacter sp. NS-SX5]|uniref:kynureninase n=1 Tax=Jiulongibacter sp. NS-SX5 TaxID=3463854 RepID=UPI004059E9D8